MAKTRAEINADSNAKLGMTTKSYKLPTDTIDKIMALSKQYDIAQGRLIQQAIEHYETILKQG